MKLLQRHFFALKMETVLELEFFFQSIFLSLLFKIISIQTGRFVLFAAVISTVSRGLTVTELYLQPDGIVEREISWTANQ